MYDHALAAYKKVIELAPDNAAAYANIGVIYYNQNKWQDSVEMNEKSLALKPTADTYSNLATSYFYLRQYDKAVQNYKKAVELSPQDQFLVGNLASGYWWNGNRDEALKAFDEAIVLATKEMQVNPRDASLMGSMALYYARKRRPPQRSNAHFAGTCN